MSNRLPNGKFIPIQAVQYDERRASEAFAAHTALLKAERENPALGKNPAWIILRQDAFEMFSRAFWEGCA